MTPAIIDRDEFIVVGIRTVLNLDSGMSGTLWKDKFLPRQSELRGADRRHYGVFNTLSGGADGRIEYVAGVVADSLEDIPDGMVGWIIPAGKYAEAEATGPSGISRICRGIIADWLPGSGYRKVASPMFAYTTAEQPDSPDGVWMVNIPVETPEVIAQMETWLGGV